MQAREEQPPYVVMPPNKPLAGLPFTHCGGSNDGAPWSSQPQFTSDPQAAAWGSFAADPPLQQPAARHLSSQARSEPSWPAQQHQDRRLSRNRGAGTAGVIGGNMRKGVNNVPLSQQRLVRQTEPAAYDDLRTTVMLRNLPNGYNSELLLRTLDSNGFAGRYDFVYLPIDFNSLAGLGYAFVNLVSHAEAQRFWQHFEEFVQWLLPCEKPCALTWSHPQQGVTAHVERYRNSPVMHEVVPENCKPMVFADGRRVQFPRPTKPLKAPRMRSSP